MKLIRSGATSPGQGGIIFLILLCGLLLCCQECGEGAIAVNSVADTLRVKQRFEISMLSHADVARTVKVYPIDTLMRKVAEGEPIIRQVKKRTERKPFRKDRHFIDVARIDSAGKIIELSYDLASPELDFTITSEGMQTDKKSVRRANQKRKWKKIKGKAIKITATVVALGTAILIISK